MRDLVAERAPDLLERCAALVGEDPFPRATESTRFAQPAIFCASLAGWDALNIDAAAAAGHSLGELAALVGADQEDAEAVAKAAGITVANDNAPGQVVLSGPRDRLAIAEEAARE